MLLYPEGGQISHCRAVAEKERRTQQKGRDEFNGGNRDTWPNSKGIISERRQGLRRQVERKTHNVTQRRQDAANGGHAQQT